MSDAREDLCRRFLAQAGWDRAERRVLAADASFRRYDRLNRDGEPAILMDAPPPQEDVGAFHHIAGLLLDIEMSVPRPLALDREAGFLLLEDFGDRTFTRALQEGADEGELYRLAVDTLIALHQRWWPDVAGLPIYDEQRFLDEVALLTDWYLPAVTGRQTPAAVRDAYLEIWRELVPVMLSVPQSLVLRDYHVDNLMILEGREGVARCGLLDFQDAVLGPVSYDLVSLLEDARRDVSPELAAEMLARYRAAFRHIDQWSFAASYAALGAQRNAKIIGIFTRLCHRDGKPHYLHHIPRVWRLLEGDLQHPALAPLSDWFAREIPSDLRSVPEEKKTE
ncbi:phosphotransferase [Pelagibius litoralis]|uniref:Phosphotransferase n=1 Tax=Pelagibius litoralis TaxID=374515 RepID=A0A967C3U6_9PROT|nr:phosphotransferase [Pelagibius litoralis]NIA68004.1 phosphotransferase [Pelagibius litoralis]